MLFNSIHFLYFLPVVLLLHFITPNKYRWIVLLAASYYFYMAWNPIYIVLIFISTIVDYSAGRLMGKTEDKRYKKILLSFSLLANLGILFLFKYYNLFVETINLFVENNYNVTYLLLPMGISFYTFQTLSYSIDVYRGKITPEKHIGYFALYVTYFPQLVAGPIERSERLIPQLKAKKKFDIYRFHDGFRRMLWGFFKKVVIADNLAFAVSHIYDNASSMSGLTLLLGTIFFGFQIFCDFSGYTDIAIGTSKILGIDLMENFERPYLAINIKDFWRRWHISLTSWFKDYLYIPLGGSRNGILRTYINIMIVFLISGLWHGASWMFVIWGAIHGSFLILERITVPLRAEIWKNSGSRTRTLIRVSGWIYTMVVVFLAWIFFRASSLRQGIIILEGILFNGITKFSFSSLYAAIIESEIGFIRLFIVSLSILLMLINQLLEEQAKNKFHIYQTRRFQFIYITIIILTILMFGHFGDAPFIYFQF